MKIASIRVEQLRQFRSPFELNDLSSGINLIHGPNESGKSTLVRAIRAAFFERYRSSSVDDLQPWGDSSASPTVEISFETMGKHWKLTKSFLKRKRCDLQVDGESYDGEVAEEKLAELLGYQFSARGASKEEHWGIPGLLWVEQGTGQIIDKSVEYANAHLQSALNSLLGEVASSDGDDVIDSVERLRAELLTGTGKPRGEYAEAATKNTELEATLDELNERIESYQAKVDRLGELRIIQRDAENEKPWEKQRELELAAKQRLDEIESWQEQQTKDEKELGDCQAALMEYREQIRQADLEQEKLAQRKEDFKRADEDLKELQSAKLAQAEAHTEAKSKYDVAETTLESVETWERRCALKSNLEKHQRSIGELNAASEKAFDLQGRLSEVRVSIQGNKIDLDQLDRLRNLDKEVAELRIRSESVATRLSYSLSENSGITIDGEALDGSGEKLLLKNTHLRLPGYGELVISPGGEDVSSLRRQLERSEESCSALLGEMKVGSLDDAEQLTQKFLDDKREEEKLKAQIDAIAPRGIEAIREQLSDEDSAFSECKQLLDLLPEVTEPGVTKTDAEVAMGAADAELNQAESLIAMQAQEVAVAQHKRETAEREWKDLEKELSSQDREARIRRISENIGSALESQEKLEKKIKKLEGEIENARPDLLVQDVQRHGQSAEQLEKQYKDRSSELSELKGSLEALGTEGLEEQRAEVEAEAEHVLRRHKELQIRAQALDLLLNLLQEKRQYLTMRLQAPLQSYLDHYLSILFQDAHLEIDEQLVPSAFNRGTEYGHLAELSFGAREQMGLITRCAYADLLKEAGRPTLIILDDSLVHSDKQRLEKMKKILFDAGSRHQILLFSCHPESWQDLGVSPIEIRALRSSGAPRH